MTEQEKGKKPSTVEKNAPVETENLLSDFGAPIKKVGASATPKKVAAEQAPKVTDAASAPPKKSADAGEKPKAKSPAKTASTAPKKVKNHDEKEEKPKKAPKTVQASTAVPRREKAKKEPKEKQSYFEEKDGSARARSEKIAHRVVPYLLVILAIYVGLSLLLNVFCADKIQTPSDHWMGTVGYYICYGLFGTFGPAAFVLPLLIINLALFWRRYIDSRVAISKIAASLIFLISFSTLIHVANLAFELGIVSFSTKELFEYGSQMLGGGVIGGHIGYAFCRALNSVGSFIVIIFVLLISLFYFLGTTPERLWSHLRENRKPGKKRERSASEEGAEEAHNKAIMDEKIRRITGRQMTIDDEQDSTGGAAQIVTPAPQKEAKEDKLAPMPEPQLYPGSDDRLFVPADISRKLHEADRKKQMENTAAKAAQQQQAQKPAQPTPSPAPAPANPAQNRDAAIEPIFPKTPESKQVRKVPRADRNFDLISVFKGEDELERIGQREHAPLPPEVPLRPTGARPAAPTAQKPAQPTQGASTPPRPVAGANTPTRPPVNPAQPRPAGAPAASKPVQKTAPAGTVKAPSLSAVKPTAGVAKQPVAGKSEKPIIREAAAEKNRDFGLSSEEFEKLEATKATLPKSKTAGAKPTAADAKKPTAKPDPKSVTDEVAKTAPVKKYVFPPISYLRAGEPMTAENKAELEETARTLTDTLASFNVRVTGVNYSCGPTVTRYEVFLAPGVRVRSIINLSDDIALALRSSGGVRIEAPIPGTNAVGIEVPNRTRSIIYLRELIESKEFSESKGKLTACLGAGIAGEMLVFDIGKMPHLLIAGTTGSGKSVCINCIIMSLLYKVRPDEVKLILIDPKKVEFSIYKNIPHLMAPVVTTPKDAAGALQAAVEEMERRFELFESVGARDLKGYTAMTEDDPDMPKLPHIVIIIDELADLMMTAKNEVETAICRIAQKARAAGMHLIIGTQRPSADVVTGLIKANVPSSIAFAVKSQIDSRVILDHGGAEALVGRGDMLFVPIGAMRDTRVQGAFVDDKEVEKICEFIRTKNGLAQYDEKFIAKLKELAAQCGNKGKSDDVPMNDDGEKGDDPKYNDAVRVAVEEKRISTSLLQRKLGVGYSRAAKLIDRMQSEGIVSPPDGAKPRSILISPEEYIERFVMAEGNEDE